MHLYYTVVTWKRVANLPDICTYIEKSMRVAGPRADGVYPKRQKLSEKKFRTFP